MALRCCPKCGVAMVSYGSTERTQRWRCPRCERLRRQPYHQLSDIGRRNDATLTPRESVGPQTPNGGLQPWLQDPDITLYQGDCLDVLRQLPEQSIHMCVTSPPYYGLRDYGTGEWQGGDPDCDHQPRRWEGPKQTQGAQSGHSTKADRLARTECRCGARRIDKQLGLEETPFEFVDSLVEVMREVRRVLRDDGTLWLNLGSTYAANRGYQVPDTKHRDVGNDKSSRVPYGFKPKDLIGVPWMAALALQADGWWLRSEIIWAKGNPLPESVSDRPTQGHEHIFLLSKRANYFFDQEPLRTKYQYDGRRVTHVQGREGSLQHRNGERWPGLDTGHAGANVRTVWQINAEPFPGAHFAVFPTEIPRRAILAGTSEKGVCAECGTPWIRETERVDQGWDGSRYGERVVAASEGVQTGGTERSTLGSAGGKLTGKSQTLGWRSGCNHDAEPVPATVLDPFAGSGTTGLVARNHGRHSILVELNEEFCRIAAERLQQLSLLT